MQRRRFLRTYSKKQKEEDDNINKGLVRVDLPVPKAYSAMNALFVKNIERCYSPSKSKESTEKSIDVLQPSTSSFNVNVNNTFDNLLNGTKYNVVTYKNISSVRENASSENSEVIRIDDSIPLITQNEHLKSDVPKQKKVTKKRQNRANKKPKTRTDLARNGKKSKKNKVLEEPATSLNRSNVVYLSSTAERSISHELVIESENKTKKKPSLELSRALRELAKRHLEEHGSNLVAKKFTPIASTSRVISRNIVNANNENSFYQNGYPQRMCADNSPKYLQSATSTPSKHFLPSSTPIVSLRALKIGDKLTVSPIRSKVRLTFDSKENSFRNGVTNKPMFSMKECFVNLADCKLSKNISSSNNSRVFSSLNTRNSSCFVVSHYESRDQSSSKWKSIKDMNYSKKAMIRKDEKFKLVPVVVVENANLDRVKKQVSIPKSTNCEIRRSVVTRSQKRKLTESEEKSRKKVKYSNTGKRYSQDDIIVVDDSARNESSFNTRRSSNRRTVTFVSTKKTITRRKVNKKGKTKTYTSITSSSKQVNASISLEEWENFTKSNLKLLVSEHESCYSSESSDNLSNQFELSQNLIEQSLNEITNSSSFLNKTSNFIQQSSKKSFSKSENVIYISHSETDKSVVKQVTKYEKNNGNIRQSSRLKHFRQTKNKQDSFNSSKTQHTHENTASIEVAKVSRTSNSRISKRRTKTNELNNKNVSTSGVWTVTDQNEKLPRKSTRISKSKNILNTSNPKENLPVNGKPKQIQFNDEMPRVLLYDCNNSSITSNGGRKTNLFLKPGKQWFRSLSLLRKSIHEQKRLSEPAHKKGRKWRTTVCNLYEGQNKNNQSLYFNGFDSAYLTQLKYRNSRYRQSVKIVEEPTEEQSYLQKSGYISTFGNESVLESFEKLSLTTDAGNREEAAKEIILKRCNQTAPVPFEKCFTPRILQRCRKIGEGVYGEVFMYKAEDGRCKVIKIIPIEGNLEVNGERQKKYEEIFSEIIIASELSNLRTNKEFCTDGFAELLNVHCIKGKYPTELIDLWDLYDEDRGSENDSPEIFSDDQLYIVLELANGGKDLESYQFTNAEQTYALFVQIVCAMAVAETAVKFEHRDMHWGNILISPTDEPTSSVRLNGRELEIANKGVKLSIIDFTLSRITYDNCCIYNDLAMDPDLFTAIGDYQFDIYRLMQKRNENNWQKYEPYSNILWLDYTLEKMTKQARYLRSGTRTHKNFLRRLTHLRKDILSYNSATELLNSDVFSHMFL